MEPMVPKSLFDALLRENFALKKALKIKENTAVQAMNTNSNLFNQKEGMLKNIGKLENNIKGMLNELKIEKRNKEVSLTVSRARKDTNLSSKTESEIKIIDRMIFNIESKLVKNIFG